MQKYFGCFIPKTSATANLQITWKQKKGGESPAQFQRIGVWRKNTKTFADVVAAKGDKMPKQNHVQVSREFVSANPSRIFLGIENAASGMMFM